MTRRQVLMALLLALGLAVAGPARAAEMRIVSIGGSVTEVLFALGYGGRIVADDTTSIYPPEAAALPKIGYMRTLAAEPIVALSPDLVIAVDHAGPKKILDQIAAAGVPVVIVSDRPTDEGVSAKIREVAKAVGAEARGEELVAGIEKTFARIKAVLGQEQARPSVLYILSASDGAPLAAGQNTAADGMIRLAGGRNAIQGYDGYKPLSPEVAVTANPDYVVVAQHGIDTLGGIEGLAKRPDLGLVPAVKEGRVLVLDANYLLGFGPRAPQATAELASHLHPALASDLAIP
ncbi:MAG TPA: ABC transporter substrate-binding protein [Hypericibacter adhaerens]|jgi:iron complex transport system substrate-binding protein|uniref:Hemin ABC transporter substrate-binding protein n=1 Tax=Hypericibacter adhaerens TaxID=2602016 RepID=A0A5J6MXL2_9PROT|nr:ABC transporter substrate-binding protein [Hypericibacter adhaerens]QEX22269.1 hemin ABC transporter substrate-binding protein [Hypericibacter adhaerens]HWA43776.1 ABC transporter substrate-binding protein [Hypericibacter adhaerens]